jgi:hypothetical protein
MPDPMAGDAAVAHGAGMRTAENELYERACELVEAAEGIRRSSEARASAVAVPAALACMQDAIANLARACVALERAVQGPADDDRIERMHRGFANLAAALDDAQRAGGAARALAARALERWDHDR